MERNLLAPMGGPADDEHWCRIREIPMSKKTKRAASIRTKIQALLKNIEGPLPERAAGMVRSWLLTDQPHPDLLPLLDKYARADLVRSALPTVPSHLKGYPETVKEAQQLLSRLQSARAQNHKTSRKLEQRQAARVLDRLHSPHPEDVRAERRRDKNPLHGTSILKGASRAKRDRSRYHPDLD